MKTSNENLLSWQACVHRYAQTHIDTDTHRLFTIPLRALRQMAFSHVKGHKWNSLVSINLDPLQLQWQREVHQYETLQTSGWRTTKLTAEEFMPDHIKVHIIQWADSWAALFPARWRVFLSWKRHSVLHVSWKSEKTRRILFYFVALSSYLRPQMSKMITSKTYKENVAMRKWVWMYECSLPYESLKGAFSYWSRLHDNI